MKRLIKGSAREPQAHDFLFDVKLFALIHVQAVDEISARGLLAERLDTAVVTVLVNGTRIQVEASHDGPADLIERDGRDVT